MHYRLRDFLYSLSLVVLVALSACSQETAPRPEPAAPVSVAKATKKSVPDLVTAVGSVEAINSVAIKSLVDGQLLESLVRDGDVVKKGQLLFRIDPRPAQATLAQANAALAKDEAARDLAHAQVLRYQPIAEKHFISADQMQQYVTAESAAAASVKVDQANVEAMKLTLGYTDIHAPIEGRAGRILVQAGNLVKANDTQALLTINQLSPIFVNFALPGQDVDRVRAAQAKGSLAVQATGDGIDGKISGELSFVDNAIDQATNTVKLRASFANADERLWPGQFVNIALTLGSGEYVTSVKLCEGKYNNTTRIFYAQFTTSTGNTLAGGTTTSDCVTRTAPSGWQVAGFQGRSGDEVDKLGFIYTKR